MKLQGLFKVELRSSIFVAQENVELCVTKESRNSFYRIKEVNSKIMDGHGNVCRTHLNVH